MSGECLSCSVSFGNLCDKYNKNNEESCYTIKDREEMYETLHKIARDLDTSNYAVFFVDKQNNFNMYSDSRNESLTLGQDNEFSATVHGYKMRDLNKFVKYMYDIAEKDNDTASYVSDVMCQLMSNTDSLTQAKNKIKNIISVVDPSVDDIMLDDALELICPYCYDEYIVIGKIDMAVENVSSEFKDVEITCVFWDDIADTRSLNKNAISRTVESLSGMTIDEISDEEYDNHYLNISDVDYLPYLKDHYFSMHNSIYESSIELALKNSLDYYYKSWKPLLTDESIKILNEIQESGSDVIILTTFASAKNVERVLNKNKLSFKVYFIDLKPERWFEINNIHPGDIF